MNVYEFSKSLGEREIKNVVCLWEEKDLEKLELYNSLVRLGDSAALACSTVMMQKEKSSEEYIKAYES